jgi:hypothetical protein
MACVKARSRSARFGRVRTSSAAGCTRPAESAIADAIALAEAPSARSCEVCGDAGVMRQVGGQLLTAYSRYAKGAPIPIEPGRENLHLLRGSRDGKAAILVCRRYVRAASAFHPIATATRTCREVYFLPTRDIAGL